MCNCRKNKRVAPVKQVVRVTPRSIGERTAVVRNNKRTVIVRNKIR